MTLPGFVEMAQESIQTVNEFLVIMMVLVMEADTKVVGREEVEEEGLTDVERTILIRTRLRSKKVLAL